jgi:hypothetical protein
MVYDLRVYDMIEKIQSQSPVEKLFKYCSPSSRPKMFEDQKIWRFHLRFPKMGIKSSTFMGFSIVNNPAGGPHVPPNNPRGAMTQGRLAAKPRCQIRAFLKAVFARSAPRGRHLTRHP